jgi:hypothetical protein
MLSTFSGRVARTRLDLGSRLELEFSGRKFSTQLDLVSRSTFSTERTRIPVISINFRNI